MPTAKRSSRSFRRAIALAVLSVLPACASSSPPIITVVATPSMTPTTSSTPSPTLTPTASPTPTPTPTPAGWERIGEGVQVRQMYGTEGGRGGYAYALRLDPARIDVQLRYDRERPRKVSDWFAAEQPIAALNAGFFTQDYAPAGVWVIDDVAYGLGHQLMEAELRITGAGIYILRLSERYKTDHTRTIAAVESYPLLIQSHQIPPTLRDGSPAERLVVGIDGAGALVFVLVPSSTFSLHGLAEWLMRSDLNLEAALNLDGGSSAGMLVQTGDGVWGGDSGREVPGALIVLPKTLGVNDGGSP